MTAGSAEEPGLFFSFFEGPEALRAKAAALELDLEGRLNNGAEIIWNPPYAGILDAMTARVLENVRRRGVRRLFIDGLGGVEQMAFIPERVIPVVAAFLDALRQLGVTTMYTWEMTDLLGEDLRPPQRNISEISHNFLLLRYSETNGVLERRISVLKMRANAFDPAVHRFSIGRGGISVGPPAATAAAS